MKTILQLGLLVCLQLILPGQCLALQVNADVSPERARELGVVIRSHPDGENGVKVWLEFAPEGVLKNFTHVELRISADGKSMVSAPLFTTHPTPATVTASFSTDPGWLATSILTIVVQGGPRDRVGYQFKVKDFVTLETPR